MELPKKQPDIESHLYRANRAIRNSEKIIQRNIEKSIAMKPVVSEKVVEVIRPKPKIRTKSGVRIAQLGKRILVSAGLSIPAINTANIARIGTVSPKREKRIAPVLFPLQFHPFANLEKAIRQSQRKMQLNLQNVLQNIKITLSEISSVQLQERTKLTTRERLQERTITATKQATPRTRIPPRSPRMPAVRIPKILPPYIRPLRIVMPEGIESSIKTTLKTIEHQMAKLKQLL